MGTNDPNTTPSRNTLTRDDSRSGVQSEMSYTWANNDSMFSGDVDRWLGGDTGSRAQAAMRDRLSEGLAGGQPPWPAAGFWYVAAMVLPLVNLNVCRNWTCTPSHLLNAAELMLTQMVGYCRRARSRVRGLTRARAAQDLFAGTLDFVLVIYAFGFLLLSLYQASTFEQF